MVGASPNPRRPSHNVMAYLLGKGYRVIPVNPRLVNKTLHGQQGYERLADIPEPFDMVDIFRRSSEVVPIVEDALRCLLDRGLKTIWMQIGVENDEAARIAEKEGLTVVMNRCPKIEYQRLYGELSIGGFNSGVISSRLR